MSKIIKLVNPKSENYYNLKRYVLGNQISWYYESKSTPPNTESDNVIRQYKNGNLYEFINDDYQNHPYLSHIVVTRPHEFNHDNNIELFEQQIVSLIPKIRSTSYELYVEPFLKDLIISNHESKLFQYRSPLRINFNMTFSQGSKPSIPHVDHYFSHKNMLIYFTDTGGDTIVGDDNFTPKEDDIIVFNSDCLHCMRTPENGRRVVMVMTYI